MRIAKRKDVARYGKRGSYVRVVLETGGKKFRVLWKNDRGERKAESFEGGPKGKALAIAFAEGILEAKLNPMAIEISSITLREVWERYDMAEDHWRPKTRLTNRTRWNQFELFAGARYPAEKVTLEFLDEFRRALKQRGIVANQIREHIGIVKATFRWAMHRDLIPPSKVPIYRFKKSKDEPKIEQREFSLEDTRKVLAQFDPRSSRAWRPYVAVTIAALQGPRENAMLHLVWDDVDFEAGTIRWRPEWDKLGTDRLQPMVDESRDALFIALGWRQWSGYKGPYVFAPVQQRRADRGEPWTYAAAIKQLDEACKAAGVRRDKYQGYHAFRRGAAGNASELSGNPQTGMHWIGDRDMRQSSRYLRTRDAQMESVAKGMKGSLKASFNPESATQLQQKPKTQTPLELSGAVTSDNTDTYE